MRHKAEAVIAGSLAMLPLRRERKEVRWLLVHEAGCVECRACHDDELLRELVAEGVRLGVSIPRSLRRFA